MAGSVDVDGSQMDVFNSVGRSLSRPGKQQAKVFKGVKYAVADTLN